MKEIREQRIETSSKLKQKGLEPYGRKFIKENNFRWLIENFVEEKKVTSAGRIMNIRGHGKTFFMDIKDVTSKIQLYFKKDLLSQELAEILLMIDIGDIVGFTGRLFKTKTGELTIFVDEFTILSKSIRPLPEKWHGLKDVEIRYRQRYLDLIVNDDVRDRFIVRSKLIKETRAFLESKSFMEVETPMMQAIAGGAAARPFVTHHNTLDLDLYLRIAPELYLKRLLVGGFEKIFEINRNFRNEGISPWHNPEFTMIEVYSAYDDYKDMMNLTEELVEHLLNNVIHKTTVTVDDKEINFARPWRVLSMKDSLKEYAGIDIDNSDLSSLKKQFCKNIKNEISKEEIMNIVFEEAVEHKLINPTFIVDYPACLCPLSKTKKENPAIAERFELFIGGKEVANAYSELNDPIEQKERFLQQSASKEADETYSMDEDFIRALEFGMPPAGGLGIGIDRLVMVLTGASNVRDVILFPQLRKEQPEAILDNQ